LNIRRSITTGFAISLLLLLVVGIVSFRSTSRLLDSANAVERGQRVQTSLEEIIKTVVDAETGSRGYALTGEREYLEPYTQAVDTIDSQIAELKGILGQDPIQTELADTLQRLITTRLAAAGAVISARDSGGLESAAEQIAAGPGKAITDEIRSTVEEMRGRELRNLEAIRSSASAAGGLSKTIVVVGSVGAIVVVIIFGLVTHRQMAARERAQEERDLHFNSSLDMLCVAGFDGYFKQLNPAWTKTLGWSEDDLQAKPWLDFVHPDDVEQTVAAGAQITGGNALASFENRYRCQDGTYRWISWNSVPLTEKQLIYCVARDVTEQKRSRRQFESLFESSPNGLLLVDKSRNMVLINAELARMFGYDPPELLGQPVETLVPDGVRDRHPGYVRGFWASPSRRAMGTVPNLYGRCKDGTEIPVHIALTPIESEDGLQVLAAIVDLSERKKSEDRVNALNEVLLEKSKELETANRELEAFSYSVSHDLRAPLRAIDGFSRVLADKYAADLPPDAQRYLKTVRDNTSQMGQLIDDLLAFSRLSRQPINRKRLAPATQVREALDTLRDEYADRQIEFRVDELASCEGDPALLRQVWINLLSNAIKYTRDRERATVEIGCRSNGNGEAIYFVKDNGAGFDMQYANKLFGVFQRLHRAEEYEGTGVGLATVQRIIHRHGGQIWAESEVDKGTTFSFTLGGPTEHE
jgi:PAS domain S-box-containing protein